MLSRSSRCATIQTSRAPVPRPTLVDMSNRKKPDPRTVSLAKQINSLGLSSGQSQNQLTDAAGIKPQQWSALLHGRSGIGDAKLHNIAAAAGTTLVLARVDNDRPAFIGTASAGGRVTMTGTMKLPAFVEVTEACGDYQPGDEVIIVEGDYKAGERLLIAGPRGLLFADAFERNGEQRLRTLAGETFDFDPTLHMVIGIEDGFRRRRRR